MAQRRIQRQIHGILEANGLRWSQDGDTAVLRFDSAIVLVDVTPWGAQHLIQLRANVLRDIEQLKGEMAVAEVNRLNCETLFGKWAYYDRDGVLSLEYDMLADHLQEAELMTALTAVARLADHHDDDLQTRLGGSRAFERAASY